MLIDFDFFFHPPRTFPPSTFIDFLHFFHPPLLVYCSYALGFFSKKSHPPRLFQPPQLLERWEYLLHTIDPKGSTCKVLGFVFTHLGKNSSEGLDLRSVFTWLTSFCGICGLNCGDDPQISANKQHKVTNHTIIVLLIMPVTFLNHTLKNPRSGIGTTTKVWIL